MYNKLFTKILDSSIWLESVPTRIVWLTFIAVMDDTGFVQFASVANVAHRARVSLEDAEIAIAVLESPDTNSSDPDNEGRRVERVPGGWIVLNAGKHRDMVTRAVIQEQTRERVRRHREKHGRNAPVTQTNEKLTPSEAEAVSRAVSESSTSSTAMDQLLAALPTDAVRGSWQAELAGARTGIHGISLTPIQIETACRDYIGNGHSAKEPSLRHFRAFLRNAGKPVEDKRRRSGVLTDEDWKEAAKQAAADEERLNREGK